jgi:hypothetical protein
VPPALAAARADWADVRFARSDASVALAWVASILAITRPLRTRSPTATVSAVSVPLVANVGDAEVAAETLPEADTLDSTVPRVTVTVRATPLADDDEVP